MLFHREADHWLFRYSPREWLSAAVKELEQAEVAQKNRNRTGAITGCKRAAGMALNAALILEPNERWGRTYVEHLAGLEEQAGIPEVLREACRTLLSARSPGPELATLRTPRTDERIFEAARDVLAHAYTIIIRHQGMDA